MAQVTLKDIIDIVMLQSADPDSYLYGVDRTIIISYAKRLLQELNYAGLRSVRIVMTEVYASGKVELPDDYVEYTKIFYCIGNYLLPVFHNNTINLLQWKGIKDFEEQVIYTEMGKKIYTESGDYLTTKILSGEKVQDYGYIKNLCSMKGYKYDHENNYLIFDYIPEGVSHVAVEYVADPLVSEPDPSKLSIHKYFQKAIEAGIYCYVIEKRRNVPMNEKIRAKKEWNIKYNDALKELNAKPFEYIQYIMGWKHMNKCNYPGMGGQKISGNSSSDDDDTENVFVEFTGEYTDFVCQKENPLIKKEIVKIDAHAERDENNVVIYCTTEKPVASEVRILCGSEFLTISEGSNSGSFIINPERNIEKVNLVIYAVDGIIGVNEDKKYIYEIVSEVNIPAGVIVKMNTIKTDVLFTYYTNETSEFIVDWGDGLKESSKNSHTYTDGKEQHEIKIYGTKDLFITFIIVESGITHLDISGNINLSTFVCSKNNIETLIIKECSTLVVLDASANKLKGIDLSDNTNLETLLLFDNRIISIDISTCLKLSNVDVSRNQLNFLDVSHNVVISNLSCSYNNLVTLDTTSNPDIEYMDCGYNKISSLDLSLSKKLLQIICSYNNLNALDVSICTNLKEIVCDFNNISSLNVSRNINVTTLLCEYNLLTELDLTNNVNIITLRCGNNPLTEPDLTHNIRIENLHIDNLSSLSVLDLSLFSNIKIISCSHNNINLLALSPAASVVEIDCSNNDISELNIINMSSLRSLLLGLNPISHDTEKITFIVNALPDLSNNTAGILGVGDSDVESAVKVLCDAKNWNLV